jgi:hypothetical protein
VTTSAEVELPALTVSPGGEATTTLTVRNETDIVEAYTLEVVGDCVEWTTVEPTRVSLYPGTSETVTVRLAPPRSSSVRAGEFPLGIKVAPVERPDLTRVPETTVTVMSYRELRGQLDPRRRRGWLRARYLTVVQNLGNADTQVAVAVGQPGEDLRFAVNPPELRLGPGESAEVGLRARTRKLIWFGASVTWPFEVWVAPRAEEPGAGTAVPEAEMATDRPEVLQGEFVQLALLPKWLLAVLAAIVALLLAWFALVRPTVQSDAKQAANAAVNKHAAALSPSGAEGSKAVGGAKGAGTQAAQAGGGTGTGSGSGAGAGAGLAQPGTGAQFSSTIDVQTGGGTQKTGSYNVPQGKVFGITDIVAANFQGDEGLLTIDFGDRTITTIALETFRNQDYHWVTPIEVPQGQKVTASVTCEKPGTPADSKPAAQCHELLNVSGVLSDMKQ